MVRGADLVIDAVGGAEDVTALRARRLNLLLRADPAYRRAVDKAVSQGALRLSGDLGSLRFVFDLAHDGIVRRTI